MEKKKIPADLRELRLLEVKELEVDRRLLLPCTAGLVGGVEFRPVYACMHVCMNVYTYIHTYYVLINIRMYIHTYLCM